MTVADITKALPSLIKATDIVNKELGTAGANKVAIIKREEATLNIIYKKFYTYIYQLNTGQRTVAPGEKAAFVSELKAFMTELIRLQKHANAAGITALNHPIHALVNYTKQLITHAGASALGTAQERALERLDTIMLKEAVAVEEEIKAELSKEAQELELEHTAWKDLQMIVAEAKQILDHLAYAEEGGAMGKKNLTDAEALITSLNSRLLIAENKVKSAVKMDAVKERVARRAAKQLHDIHSKLSKEASRIRIAKGW